MGSGPIIPDPADNLNRVYLKDVLRNPHKCDYRHRGWDGGAGGPHRALPGAEHEGAGLRAGGSGHRRLLQAHSVRHIAPNCFATYLVLATYYLGFAIILEAGLSFLGVGAPPDETSWGGMLSRATEFHVSVAPWVGIFPRVAIFVVVFGFNLLRDALRGVFDLKLRGR